jgi:hypothetical protein
MNGSENHFGLLDFIYIRFLKFVPIGFIKIYDFHKTGGEQFSKYKPIFKTLVVAT